MRPITRETITDRRQPALRWSAVFGGASVAVAVWVLLQMLGMGAGLAAIDLDSSGSLRSVGIGTTVWTLIAPLLALFVGGFVAGRLASTYDRKLGAMHGFVTWAIASLVGVLAIASLLSWLAHGAVNLVSAYSTDVTIDPGLRQSELQAATDKTGKLLLGVGISMVLSLGAAIVGSVIAPRQLTRARRRTAEVPVVPPPPEPPADAPHVEV